MNIIFRKIGSFGIIYMGNRGNRQMITQKLGINFTNLDYSVVKKKNHLPFLLLAIFALTSILITAAFLIIWLFKLPIEIDGVTHQFSDPEYQNFISLFFIIFIIIIFILSVLTFIFKIMKPKNYIFISKDINFDKLYLIIHKNSSKIILTEKMVLYYNDQGDEVQKFTNIKDVQEIKNRYIFWDCWDDLKEYKIINKTKKTILIFDKDKQGIVLNHRYYFKGGSSYYPEKIMEIVNKKTNTSNSTFSINTYYFTNNNRQVNLKLPEKVIRILNEEF